jgi:alpha-beta hydrolase superfamily lysophospholipase
VPSARVLVHGYDTRIRHVFGKPASQNTVYDIAGDFLVALEANRRVQPDRPILFIVHSLGGIVVKEMLRRSSTCDIDRTHLRTIFDSMIGIMFFGTPHGGADPRGLLQLILEKAIRAAGFQVNDQIVKNAVAIFRAPQRVKGRVWPYCAATRLDHTLVSRRARRKSAQWPQGILFVRPQFMLPLLMTILGGRRRIVVYKYPSY